MGRRVKDLIGLRFDKLVVAAFVGAPKTPSENAHAQWVCLCDCGGTRVLPSSLLRAGKTLNCAACGWARGSAKTAKKNTRDGAEAAFRIILSNYQGGARTRGLKFDLSASEFRKLLAQNCSYCGIEPKQLAKTQLRKVANTKGELTYNGIDRVDNSKGYVRGNVVACCIECNRAKMGKSLEDFLGWARRLGAYQMRVPDVYLENDAIL